MMQVVWNRYVGLALAAVMLGGCTIPRTGPYSSTITGGADAEIGGMRVIEVSGPQSVPITAPTRFSDTLRRAGPASSYLLGPSDRLSIQVWEETVSPGADGTVGEASISLPGAEIDERGEVFVPFAGRIRASGLSLSQFHERLTDALAQKLVNPQVAVGRTESESSRVNVIGKVGQNGAVALNPSSQSLLDVLTRAGGPTEEPDVSKVTLMRGNAAETLWLSDVYADRTNDVAMRAGDTVLVERDNRNFVVLGAVKEQTVVPFPARRVSALRALAEASGLNDSLADPSGIFVFRPGDKPDSAIYLLNLDRPDGMLLADGFEIADGDMIYVTNAPITTWLKIVSAISPAIGLAGSVYAIGANN
jgi:polysaccharide export outer membrane protein